MDLLNAAAKEKREDLQDLISKKYSHPKKALVTAPTDFVDESDMNSAILEKVRGNEKPRQRRSMK